MSTHNVTVEVVSANNTKWVTLECTKSVNAYDLSRLISNRNESKPKPEHIVLRDRHGARLQPNNRISRVNDRRGTHVIAEVLGECRAQRQPDTVMSSANVTSCTDDSEDIEDLTRASSAEDSEDLLTPTEIKRRKVESDKSLSTIDLSNYASPLEMEGNESDPAKKIQTKRKSRTRITAKAALQTLTDDSSSHGEDHCQGCDKPLEGIVDGSPTTRFGLKRKHESDRSPTKGSPRARPTASHTCTCCDVKEKFAINRQGQNTPTNAQVIEVGEDSPKKIDWDVDVKTPKEERLSRSLGKIHLDDATDIPDRNLCATQSLSKMLGESATTPERAMTLSDKREATLAKSIASSESQDSVDSEHSDVALLSDLADDQTSTIINKDVCHSAGATLRSIRKESKAKDATAEVSLDTCGKDAIAIQVERPTSSNPRSPTEKVHFIVVPVSASSLSTTANRSVSGGVCTGKQVPRVPSPCLVKPVVSAGSTSKTINNVVNCLAVPVSKASGQSSGILVNQANTPAKPLVPPGPTGTIICEITLTKHVTVTPPVTSTVDRSCSRVLKTYPGKARRSDASKKSTTRANSKSEINLICVDTDGGEENSSMPVQGGYSQPSNKEGEVDANVADPILINIGKNELRKSDVDTLEEGEWLNDCVINAYFFLLSVVSPLNIFTHSSFFFFSLFKRGYEGVKRWTKNVDLFRQDLVFIPIHNKSHWSLVVVHIKEGIMEYYNSSTMLDGYPRSMMHIRDYLKAEAKHREKAQFTDIKWEMYMVEDIPRQQNMDDCGLFICQYAKKLSFKQKVNFDIKESINLRQQMRKELLNGKIEVQ